MGRCSKLNSNKTESIQYFQRLNQVLLLAAALLPLLLLIWNWRRISPIVSPTSAAIDSARANENIPLLTTAAMETRRVFPYSVIPGGAHDAQELKTALTNDPVAAGHYAGFDVARTRVVQLKHDELMYVSYRMNDRIYWTSKRLMLPAGETVLTDGENEARTRCGNRLSETPELPVSPKEPERAMLERPAPLVLPAVPEVMPEEAINRPFAGLPEIAGADPVGGRLYIPPFIPIWGDSGTPSLVPPNNPPPTPPTPPTPPPPPIATPEPTSLLLLSAGLFGVFALRRKHQS